MQLGDWEPVWAVWLAHTPPWWSEYITGNIEGNCIISQFSLTHPINKIDTWERYTNKHHVWTSANLASIYKTIDLRFINLALSSLILFHFRIVQYNLLCVNPWQQDRSCSLWDRCTAIIALLSCQRFVKACIPCLAQWSARRNILLALLWNKMIQSINRWMWMRSHGDGELSSVHHLPFPTFSNY